MRVVFCLVTIVLAVSLSGCAAITVVDTAVSVTSTVVETAVDVTAGAVRAVAGSSSHDEKKPDCEGDDKDKGVCKKPASDKPAS